MLSWTGTPIETTARDYKVQGSVVLWLLWLGIDVSYGYGTVITLSNYLFVILFSLSDICTTSPNKYDPCTFAHVGLLIHLHFLFCIHKN